MTSLGDLFPEPDTDVPSPRAANDREALRRDVEALFGPRDAPVATAVAPALDAEAIAAIFTRPVPILASSAPADADADPDVGETAAHPPVPAVRPATPRRTPWLRRAIISGSAVVVVAAVAAVVLVASGGLNQRADLEAAQQQLTTERAAFAEAQQEVGAAGTRLQTTVAAALSDADAMDAALTAAAGYVDEGVRTAAVSATAAYRASLKALPTPGSAPAAPQIDDASAASVAEGIDELRKLTGEADDLTTTLAGALADVDELSATYRAALAPLGAAVTATANAEVAAAPDAAPELHAAVATAAQAVGAALSGGLSPAKAITAFPPTVAAVRAAQQEAERVRREAEDSTDGSGTTRPSTPTAPADPGPTEPVTPEPAPTDPGTTDPGDGQVTPQPEASESGAL